jgi:hypothetical protein
VITRAPAASRWRVFSVVAGAATGKSTRGIDAPCRVSLKHCISRARELRGRPFRKHISSGTAVAGKDLFDNVAQHDAAVAFEAALERLDHIEPTVSAGRHHGRPGVRLNYEYA